MILVYDISQTLLTILGDFSTASEFGSVTSLAISQDNQKLASGYSQGVICVWDLKKYTVLREMNPVGKADLTEKDRHVRGTPITQMSFLSRSTDLITCDADVSSLNLGEVLYLTHHFI
jgi:vacuolar protein sorting-associated protein 8